MRSVGSIRCRSVICQVLIRVGYFSRIWVCICLPFRRKERLLPSFIRCISSTPKPRFDLDRQMRYVLSRIELPFCNICLIELPESIWTITDDRTVIVEQLLMSSYGGTRRSRPPRSVGRRPRGYCSSFWTTVCSPWRATPSSYPWPSPSSTPMRPISWTSELGSQISVASSSCLPR